jgi:hypothetical protein
MYGLRRSPIRAAFQNMPINLCSQSAQFCPTDPRQKLQPRCSPNDFLWRSNAPLLIAVQYCREDIVDVGARADEEEEDEQEALEVEQRRLGVNVSKATKSA